MSEGGASPCIGDSGGAQSEIYCADRVPPCPCNHSLTSEKVYSGVDPPCNPVNKTYSDVGPSPLLAITLSPSE